MVPPCSDRIARVPPYSNPTVLSTCTGLSPMMPGFPSCSNSYTIGIGLIRVRSPLLAESLLMSFPPGTEMFQFPGFAPAHYVFMCRSARKQGLPHSEIFGSKLIRSSPKLIAAYHVLHRLSVPRHPPNALKSLDHSHYRCPSGVKRPLTRQSVDKTVIGVFGKTYI